MVVADETKSYAEAGLCEETAVLMVGNLPDLPERVRKEASRGTRV